MNKIISITLTAITLLALALAYNFLQISAKFKSSLKQSRKLQMKLDVTQEQVVASEVNLKQKQIEISRLNKDISELSYPARLKKTLADTQKTVYIINQELKSLRVGNLQLKRESSTLKSRLQGSSKEIVRLTKELENIKKTSSFSKTKSNNLLFNNKLKQIKEDLFDKEKNINFLKEELEEIKKKYLIVLDERNSARKEILSAQSDRTRENISDNVRKRKIEKLEKALEQQKREKYQLERKLKKFGQLDNLELKLKKIQDQQADTRDLNNSLQREIIELSSLLKEKEGKIKSLEGLPDNKLPSQTSDEFDALRGRLFIQKERLQRVATLYDHLKVQLKDVATILVKREETLQYKTREIDLLRDEVSYLKNKLVNMQVALKQSQESQRVIAKRLSEVSNLNATLHDQLADTVDFLSRQKIPDSLLNDKITFESYLLEDQEQINNRSGSVGRRKSSEKERIEEMRKKVEVILQPF